MTCILGLKSNDIIYMAGDRSISVGSRQITSSYPKVQRLGDEAVIGMAGSSKTIAVIETMFEMPEIDPDVEINLAVRQHLIPAFRTAVAAGNALGEDDDCDTDVEILMGWRGELVYIMHLIDHVVIQEDVFCVGIFDSAHVVLSVTSGKPENRLIKTLKACAKEMPGGISGPFDVVSI